MERDENRHRRFEHTYTDVVDVTVVGEVAVCCFTWANDESGPDMLVVPAAALSSVDASDNPVREIGSIRPLVVLTDAGADRLWSAGAGFLFDPWRKEPGLVAERFDEIVDSLEQMDSFEVRRHVIEPAFHTNCVWGFAASDAQGPLNLPVETEISSRYVDIDAAFRHIAEHPMVKAIERCQGRPGSYDHVPPSLRVTVQLDDGAWAKAVGCALERYGRFSQGSQRPPGPDRSVVEELLTWHLLSDRLPIGDPLGLVPFARGNYSEPSGDDF